jgi:hypothetical protein
MATKKSTPSPIVIPKLEKEGFKVTVIGLPGSDFITHKFPQKDIDEGLGTIEGVEKVVKKPKRIPWKEFLDGMYVKANGNPAFKAVGFKKAMAFASLLYDNITIKHVNRVIHIYGEDGGNYVDIYGDCYMHASPVVLGGMGRTTQIRYRPAFTDWWATLTVTYIKHQVTKETVLTLLETAGQCIGVGELRPDKTGHTDGMFRLASDADVKKLKKRANWKEVLKQNGCKEIPEVPMAA